MKPTIAVFVICCIGGCNSNPVDNSGIATSFSISDTTGNPTNIFHGCFFDHYAVPPTSPIAFTVTS